MRLGIHISVHNGNVNVKQVRDAGYNDIIIRVGYGRDNIDQRFSTNASACVNLGYQWGFTGLVMPTQLKWQGKKQNMQLMQSRNIKQDVPLHLIWQKSNTGRVKGISGNVDINEFYEDFEQVEVGEEEKAEVVANINILNFQKAANADGYKDQSGKRLVEDGIDGSRTRYVGRQIFLKASRTIFGYRRGSEGAVVRWWQTRLSEMGFKTKIDGIYGRDTRLKTLQMQKKYNLVSDGIAGYNSITAAFYN